MIGNLDKNISMGPQSTDTQPEYKKIQDYIYRFADQIGMGNFSKVFKGTHQTSNKQVAIKIIQLNTLTNTRLQQLLNTQTKILKMLAHPNVIGCEQILSSVRNCYIITELCNGGDLERKLRKVGQFREKDVYNIVVDVYEGLKYLAKKNIIHRDLKVSNIFINNGVHKIADFGFAQISEYLIPIIHRTQFKDISVGSPIYMSPQGYISNIYGPKTDVWAFGVLLYELVEGKTPCYDCRTEVELRQRLMKQIDYGSFSSHVSSELKNLIIQCLETNPALRIRVSQIENTLWMKKAYSHVNQSKKNQQKQNHLAITTTNNYRKLSQDTTATKTNPNTRPQTPKQTFTITTTHHEQQPSSYNKNFLHKFNNLIRTSQRDEDEHRRKHSTLDKTSRPVREEYQEFRNKDKEKDDGKPFYSPKNAINKFERTLGFQSSPSAKFQSLTIDKKGAGTDESLLIVCKDNKNKNDSIKNQANTINKKEQSNIVKLKNTWIEKHPSRDNKIDGKIQKDKYMEPIIGQNSKKSGGSGLGNQDIEGKKLEKQNLISEYKNYLTLNNKFKNYQKVTSPKTLQQTLSSLIQKPIPDQAQPPKTPTSFPTTTTAKAPTPRIIPRKLKFVDCIGLIHYCRLCYKFACLLDETGEPEQTKHFLTAWATQLLVELSAKMEEADILFSNESCLIGNLSANVAQVQKKKKLKDVTQQYLGKYNRVLKGISHPPISLKQASTYIYNLYLLKAPEFKQKTKDKKPYLYFSLIGYISVLDRQTRNLMEFVYEIKGSMEGRQIQRLLNVRISEFTQKVVEEIGVGDGTEGG